MATVGLMEGKAVAKAPAKEGKKKRKRRKNPVSTPPQTQVDAQRKECKGMHSAAQDDVGLRGGYPADLSDVHDKPLNIVWSPTPEMQAAVRAYEQSFDSLRQEYPNQWVAFAGEEFLGAADDELTLTERFNPDNSLAGRFYTNFVDAH